MPTYDYGCTDDECSHEFETIHSIKDDALVRCPKCHKDTLKRLIGETNFNLKGGGWYADGYSNKQGNK